MRGHFNLPFAFGLFLFGTANSPLPQFPPPGVGPKPLRSPSPEKSRTFRRAINLSPFSSLANPPDAPCDDLPAFCERANATFPRSMPAPPSLIPPDEGGAFLWSPFDRGNYGSPPEFRFRWKPATLFFRSTKAQCPFSFPPDTFSRREKK